MAPSESHGGLTDKEAVPDSRSQAVGEWPCPNHARGTPQTGCELFRPGPEARPVALEGTGSGVGTVAPVSCHACLFLGWGHTCLGPAGKAVHPGGLRFFLHSTPLFPNWVGSGLRTRLTVPTSPCDLLIVKPGSSPPTHHFPEPEMMRMKNAYGSSWE